ncbi:hypothetical protein [Prevotella sp. 10(H)]|uniref:hypothetical protein n=1 Tax=Prevotella sp. 10(H) TaxID=1158294 RepID=UPI0004A74A1A|nr:hypothetical protein [Prevotella sp. 10(H)]
MKTTSNTQKLLLLALLGIISLTIKAQVTIGSNTPTESYEILRIDGSSDKGLRLSRLTQAQRDEMTNNLITISTAKKEAAKGLVIYNTTYGRIEYWNGDEWYVFGSPFNLSNGLRLESNTAKLGNDLTEDTQIDQQGYNMSFRTRRGLLTINTDALHVDSLDVKNNNLDEFYVDTVFTVKNKKDVALNTGKSGFSVNNNTLRIVNDSVRINNNFQYRDGNEHLATATTNIILGSKSTTGKSNWKELLPSVVNRPFRITWNIGDQSGTGPNFLPDYWHQITNNLQLEKGKWLLIGRLAVYSSYATNQSSGDYANYMSYIRLVKDDSGSGTVLYTSSTLPERKSTGGNENGGSYSVPQMIYYLDASDSATYHIEFKTKKKNTWRTAYNNSSNFNIGGSQYFYAIKLND